jgi:UDP-glucose 4-epimerase
MRIVVTGATGNVGTSTLLALASDPGVTSILGLSRRGSVWQPPKTVFARADVSRDDLAPFFRGAHAVVHLAWLIQPSRDEATLARTNLDGSARVFAAAAAAGVPALVYASSVGAYAARPSDDRPVDETWPTTGIATSVYSRHKAIVERMLNDFEREHPAVRVVRLRPALIFKRQAASEIRRLFLGPLFPNPVLRPGWVPLLPDIPGLRFQAVHSLDVGDAYRLATLSKVRGAFNIAAAPLLDLPRLARLLDARTVPIPAAAARAFVSAAWRLHLEPADPGWLDMAMQAPLLATERARRELNWQPRRTALEALAELIAGMRDGTGFPTPPLQPGGIGWLRLGELASGIGSRQHGAAA